MRGMVWSRLTHSLDASRGAAKLEEALNQLSTAMQDAETSQRGYLLTGEESYLQPFRETESSLDADFKLLAATAFQDAVLESELLELRGLTELKMSEIRETIRLRHDKGLKEAMAVVNTDRGREEMEKIRKLMWQMRQRRQNIFSSAWEHTREDLNWAQTTGQAIGFLGLGAGIFALYFLRVSFVQERARWKLQEEKLGAEKVVVEKSTFLANMSHEIRTPMNAILGFGELLDGEALTPRQSKYVRAIRESAGSLLQLINDVLDLSKLEAGKLELHLEPTDLRETCDFLQIMFGQQAAMKGLQLKFETDPAPSALLLDKLRLRQVLVNLMSNAVKFTLQGRVTLRMHWQPKAETGGRGTLLIEVEDTGVGISPEKQGEIFQPFVQAVPGRHLEHQGTGLGLSIVQRLTQVMNGAISLESSPGAGSLFRLKIPDVAVSARLPLTDARETEAVAEFNDFVPTTILVVDDNQTNRDLMAGLFQKTHHRLRFAADGREALASITEERPALVLMDLRMPLMDGQAALAEIRKRPGLVELPVVAVTASSDAEEEKELRRRFNGYVRKPFSKLTLYEELAQFLPRHPQARETPTGGGGGGSPASGNLPALLATARRADTPETAMKELSLLQQTEWPTLRDSLAINDTLAFARRLRELGQTMQNGTLTIYADRLATDAQTYAVRDLERSLAEFPALVDSLTENRKQA